MLIVYIDILSVKGEQRQAVCEYGVPWAANTGEYRWR